MGVTMCDSLQGRIGKANGGRKAAVTRMSRYTAEERRSFALKAAQTRKENAMRGKNMVTIIPQTPEPIVSKRSQGAKRGWQTRKQNQEAHYSPEQITQWGVDGNGIKEQRKRERGQEIYMLDKDTYVLNDVEIRRKGTKWEGVITITVQGTLDAVIEQILKNK